MNISQSYIFVSIIVIAILVLLVIVIGKKRGIEMINKPLFAIGLLIVGVAVTLLLMDIIESGVAALIGIVGIGLASASGRLYIK